MGFAKAASALLGGMAPRVTDTFDSAANATAGYARGLGDAVQTPVDQTIAAHNSFLTQTGAPASALETAAPIGNTAYGLEGYIPASTLQREGAAYRAAAEMLPADVLGRGQQDATAALNDNSTIAKLQASLADIAAKQPELYQSILGHMQDQAYRGAELNLRSQSLASENAYRQAELGQSQERLGITAAHYKQEERLALLNYGLSAARLQDAEKKAQQARNRSGLTPSELDTVHSHAQDFLKGLYEGIPGHVTYPNSSNGMTAPRIDSWSQKPVKYQKAIKLLIQRYPALGAQAAINIANSFYRPGEGGRPAGQQPNLSIILGPAGGAAPPDSPFAITGGHHLAQIKDPHERALAGRLVGMAQQYIGTPYVWGGESPKGFDCSGFAQYLYHSAGVAIPRTTYDQWTARNGHPVAPGDLQPGDLVFFRGSDSVGGLPGHVGIYIGGGKMIDAPHTGASVRVEDVASFGGYQGARRYF